MLYQMFFLIEYEKCLNCCKDRSRRQYSRDGTLFQVLSNNPNIQPKLFPHEYASTQNHEIDHQP